MRSCSFFFFKQKTAYELRISGWSSDVCSSVLPARRFRRRPSFRGVPAGTQHRPQHIVESAVAARRSWHHGGRGDGGGPAQGALSADAEGRRTAARDDSVAPIGRKRGRRGAVDPGDMKRVVAGKGV